MLQNKRLLAIEGSVREFCKEQQNNKELEPWIETFEIMLSKERYESLKKAMSQKCLKLFNNDGRNVKVK